MYILGNMFVKYFFLLLMFIIILFKEIIFLKYTYSTV